MLQNCNIFNDGAWARLTERELREDDTIALEHGQPLVFGKHKDKGICGAAGARPRGREARQRHDRAGPVVHDEHDPNPAYAFLLARMDATPGFPTALGVLRSVEAPAYEEQVAEQVRQVRSAKGEGNLDQLLRAGDTWRVR